MKQCVIGATLVGALIFFAPAAWSQANLGLAEAPAEQVGMSKQKLERIHDAFKQEADQGKLAGTVVLVARKGKLVYADAVGFQDKEEGKPMALDALFRIYSMTKPLVSVGAMILVEEGKIQLTDPVSKFFPAFKGQQQVSVSRADAEFARVTYTSVPADREMTVQDLLRHTSGLAYGEATQNVPVKEAYAKAGLYLPGVRDFDAREVTPAEEVDHLAKARSEQEVDSGWRRVVPEDVPRPLARRRRAEATALPAWIKPQLTKPLDQAPDGSEWLHELKFDGYRMHARLDQGAVQLLTRTGLDWTPKYPAIAAAVASLPARQAYLDGDAAASGPTAPPRSASSRTPRIPAIAALSSFSYSISSTSMAKRSPRCRLRSGRTACRRCYRGRARRCTSAITRSGAAGRSTTMPAP
jgi:Beta-lactamase